MFIKSLILTQFKNYQTGNFDFNHRIVGISGLNGAGKTNLLDAIYFLCFTKSYFSRSDLAVVMKGYSGFRLEAVFIHQNEEIKVTAILRENGNKEISWNGKLYTRFSSHIGKLPAVFITPDDLRLINGLSEERRKFLDTLISQINPDYLKQLITYNKYLHQKNSFLKNNHAGNYDLALLDIYDRALATAGTELFKLRTEFLKEFNDIVKDFYHKVAQNKDEIDVCYKSAVTPDRYYDQLIQNRNSELLSQRALYGIHRDDIDLLHGKHAFKAMASQGQKKTMLFALKLAEFEILNRKKGFPPILLLDDAFEKLDENRMENLLRMICENEDAQVFITDTHKNRIKEHLQNIDRAVQNFEINRD